MGDMADLEGMAPMEGFDDAPLDLSPEDDPPPMDGFDGPIGLDDLM